MSGVVGISSFLQEGFSVVGKPKPIDPTDILGVVTRNRHAGTEAVRKTFPVSDDQGNKVGDITALTDSMGTHWLVAADDRGLGSDPEQEEVVLVFGIADPKVPEHG